MTNITLADLIHINAELETVSITVHLNEPKNESGFKQTASIKYHPKEDNLIKDWLARKGVTNLKYSTQYRWSPNSIGLQEVTFEIQRLEVRQP